MKKLILFGAAAIMMAGSATAQLSLVKDLAKAAGSSKLDELQSVLTQIQPAMTNAESANDVLTWYTAGKASFGLYDEMYKLKLMQQPVDNNVMVQALTNGFNYYRKALTLDTIVETNKDGSIKYNKDGSKKVKTKYSKDIINSMVGHVSDIATAGNDCIQNEDWNGATQAFGSYAEALRFMNADDTTVNEAVFFKGYSEYFAGDYAGSFNDLTIAKKGGYNMNNIDALRTSACANVLQGMLDNKEYDKANAFVDNALADDPNNAMLHDMKGFTKELEEGVDAALPYYRKATEVDPTYANAQYDVARCLYLKAQAIIDSNPNATNKELVPKVKPIYDEAIPYLKKTMELDPEDTKAKKVYDDILYKFEIMGVK